MPPEIYEPTTVLLVEDTIDDEELALRVLQRLDPPLLVKVARDGQAALHALGLDGAKRRRPDIVLCDLKLPKLGGDEVLRRARADERLQGVPFVVFSSSDEPSDVAKCEEYGVSEYVVKPVDYQAYGERIATVLERYLPASSSEGTANP